MGLNPPLDRQNLDRSWYIASVRRLVRIRSVEGDPYAYDLTTTTDVDWDELAERVADQPEFDKLVLAPLKLVKLTAGRKFSNMVIKKLGMETLTNVIAQRLPSETRTNRAFTHDDPHKRATQ